jgi:hypothetical protein
MDILSFMLGIITGLAMVLILTATIGMHLKRHPEIMVRKMTQSALKGMRANAADNVH